MILVDTSIWVDHIRTEHLLLSDLLENRRVVTHPYVIGELAMGSLPNRVHFLAALNNLPMSTAATHEETLHFIEHARLFSRGISYVDSALLASARLSLRVKIWTRDKRLKAVAHELALGVVLGH